MDHERATPALKVLTDSQFDRLYGSSIEIMSKIGLRIENEGMLSVLRRAGCAVENDIVHFPVGLVERCIKSAPKAINIYDRNGSNALILNKNRSYFGGGVGATALLESFDGKRRPFTKKDVENAAIIQDALPNIDFAMGVGEISDIDDFSTADLHQFHALVCNTTKPINFMATSARSTHQIIEMGSLISGGIDKLREKPFIFLFGVGPTPPLRYVKEKLERFCIAIDSGIPIVCLSAAGSGGTAPVTLAGHIVMSLAEILGAVVMSQTWLEGAPIIVGGMPLTMDMKTAIFAYGAPEFHLSNTAISEILFKMNLPSYGTGGVTDSKTLDEQAAIESAVSSYFQVLSKTDLIHDVGYIDSVLVGSFESLVMNDELIGMIRRYYAGFQIDDDHLAIDAISRVGPGGNYLVEPHTVKYFRKEQWMPSLFDRQSYDKWAKSGSKPLREKAKERIIQIMSSHRPVPIEPKIKRKLDEMIEIRQ